MSKIFVYTDSNEKLDHNNVFLSVPYKNLKDLERQNQEDWADGTIRPLVSYKFEDLLRRSNEFSHRNILAEITSPPEKRQQKEIAGILEKLMRTWGVKELRPMERSMFETAIEMGMRKEGRYWRQKLQGLFGVKKEK